MTPKHYVCLNCKKVYKHIPGKSCNCGNKTFAEMTSKMPEENEIEKVYSQHQVNLSKPPVR